MSKAKIFLACLVWLFLLTTGVVLYRLWLVPKAEQDAKDAQAQVLDNTSGSSNYKHHIAIGLDGFSGYAVLRSDAMRQQLRRHSIKAELVDDAADYNARLAALASGELDMAAFPIDALLKSSEAAGDLPATIVAILDETAGADALVAYKKKFPDIASLNNSQTRFLYVDDSPSETLLHVVLQGFDFSELSPNALEPLPSEAALLKRYKLAKPSGDEVFVTWEPIVSSMKKNPAMGVLTDTSEQSGYIVDALVVNRDFLTKNEPLVVDVLESYFHALYEIQSKKSGLSSLLKKDAEASGTQLDAKQASALADGIRWKNTQENLAHFGFRTAAVTHVEDLIDRIKRILLDTGGLASDPTGGQSSRLFFEHPLSTLHSSGFHPGSQAEDIREQGQVAKLTEAEWQELVSVGTAQVPPLVYARGTARLTEASKRKLDELAEKLQTWPMYYLMIRGNASSRGDSDANRTLAKQRAAAALQYLLSKGVPEAKMRAMDGEITGQTTVTFELGEPAY